jgi:cyclophilin family peptidyl-prolyl cis-trans isomerase/predicted DsbA family dithiol-disulfide isomerase
MFFIVFLAACGEDLNPTPAFIDVTPTMLSNLLPDGNLPDCLSISSGPTSGPEEMSLFPKVGQDDHVKGAQNADVTIIEYGDFQCPGCAALAQEFGKLEETFTSELKIVFRQLPLYDIHDKALIAAQATEVASDEGKFWELHNLLYENFGLWVSMTPESFSIWLIEQASSIGLDPISFHNKIKSPEIIDRVKSDLENALSIGLRSTPFLLINGQIYNGPTDYKSLAQIVGLIALGKRQFSTCPEMVIDPLKQYLATLQTERGEIVIQLLADKAPYTVNAFVFLAQSGWYDGITFHKVYQGIVYTGDPSGTGLGGPGFFYDTELDGSLNFDQPGVVAMENSGMDTNGSQFFITTSPNKELKGRYTIFGQVISGMDVLSDLTPRNPEIDTDTTPGDLLIKVTIVEK